MSMVERLRVKDAIQSGEIPINTTAPKGITGKILDGATKIIRDPAKMGQKKPGKLGRDTSADANVYYDAGAGTSQGPSGEGSSQFRGNLQGVSQQTRILSGRDPAHSKPEGVWNSGMKKKKES
jgi:hypothetical protein